MDTVKMDQPMPDKNNCPQCGTPLPIGALAGLCPACLLKMGVAADTVTDAKQPAFAPPSVAELAAKFPQLEILELIGKGGMGAVYKARQKQLDRIVALKILPPGIGDEPTFAERFAREAKALAKLNHPNIVTLYEFGDAGGQFYFLMEFVDGVNLRQLLHAGRIAAREALAIVPQICDALQFAHDQGIVHRDIKPENILMDRRGRVKVADFGLAKIVGNDGRVDLPVSQGGEAAQPHRPTSDLTDAGKVMGTPQYMSPEQIQAPGEVDHRADIYALGVVFYQMLTGELPGKKIEAPSKKVQIDVRLDEIVLRALEKKPELRYQQVSQVKTIVETIVATPDASRSRGDEAQTEKAEGGKRKAEMGPHFWRSVIKVTAWVAIIVIPATVGLLTIKSHYTPSAIVLSQSEFLGKFQSNEIAHATIKFDRQNSQSATISGTCFKTDKDGKVTNEAVPFAVPNVLFPQKMLDELLASGKIEASTPNVMWLNLVWGIVPFIIMGIVGLGILLILGLIIRAVWRGVNQPPGAPMPESCQPKPGTAQDLFRQPFEHVFGPQKPNRFRRWFWIGGLVLVIAILGSLAVTALFVPRNGNADLTSLANRPDKLRSLPTATVMQVGLAEPLSPWAWQELEKRNLTRQDAAHIMQGLIVWLRQKYPDGHNQPISWLDNYLKELREQQLVTDRQAIDFLVALHGNLQGPKALRIRAGERSVDFHAQCRYIWSSSLLGYVLLTSEGVVTVDGQPVKLRDNFGRNWQSDYVDITVELPALAPGKHQLKIESLTALVRADDVEGMAADAPSADWPPAAKRWTRTNEIELEIFAPGTPVVALTQEPALNPQQNGFGIKQAVVRRKGGKPQLTVKFDNTGRLPVDISFKVSARVAGQNVSGGGLQIHVQGDSQSQSGLEQSIGIAELPSDTTEADIILTPDPAQVEGNAEFKRIWGGQIIFSNVPLKRLDLDNADAVYFEPVIERVVTNSLNLGSGELGGIPWYDRTPLGLSSNLNVLNQKEMLLRKVGADLFTDAGVPFYGLDIKIVVADSAAWNDAGLSRKAAANLELANRDNLHALITSLDVPKSTFVFETRDGVQGVLQITGFTEDPRGVKIRYKLVQKEATTAAAYPGDWIWEPNSATLDRVPPIFLLRPSTLPTNWVPFDMFGKDRYLSRGKTLKDLIVTVWSQKNSEQKIVFETDLPADKFDFIVTAEPHWWDKLEAEINRRFHLTQQIEGGVNGDTVLVKNASTP